MKKKFNLLIPLAGKAQRFVDAGLTIPKPLILANNKHFIDWALDSLNIEDCNLIFVVRNDHVCSFGLDEVLQQKYGNDITIVKTYRDTKGSVDSCLYAKEYIDNDTPLIVYCIDIYFEKKFDPNKIKSNVDGLLLTFKSNSPNYSYSSIDNNGNVTNVAEKLPISNNANVGLYYFKRGSYFVNASEKMMKHEITVNDEYYIAPLYNILIEDGYKIITQDVDRMFVMGTPRELEFFEKTAMNKFGDGFVALCCDHSGFENKEIFKTYLDDFNIKYIDYGTLTNNDCDQVDYTKMACRAIQEKKCTHGVGFCRTGQAINIAANKHKGIKSALIFDQYTAQYSIKHNGANFFSFASKYFNKEYLYSTLRLMLDSEFDGGRHQVRVQKIEDIENDY